MKKLGVFLLDTLLFLSLWFIGYKVFTRYFYWYAVRLFAQGRLPIPDFLTTPFVVTLITTCLFFLIRPIYAKELKKTSLIIIYTIYTFALIFGLFGKNIGLSGFNLSISVSLQDLYYDRITVFLNLIMFIPLGLLFKPNLKHSFFFLIFILGVEWTQYHFSLGYFDIGDIITNSLGFLVGNLIGSSFVSRYIKSHIH
ncbi:VanZ family protein [Streptococcus sp. S784/96/1]|uniref:VanZ family protein n=1 Tax=Streptococcus sp. S784/96/1 TaxID=2653499 RepID=UPI00138A22E4|nr:VanZ family protein [Streptococcus sp. S784/96/1]